MRKHPRYNDVLQIMEDYRIHDAIHLCEMLKKCYGYEMTIGVAGRLFDQAEDELEKALDK